MTRRASGECTEASEDEAARKKCLHLLSLRARSRAELEERLTSAGFAQETIERVLADLERAGLVNDEEFARSWVAGRKAGGGTGRRKLRWELRRKGIGEELVRRVLEDEVDEEAELREAMELARRRLRGRQVEAKTLAQLRNLLVGRGFGFDTVDHVLQRVAKGMGH